MVATDRVREIFADAQALYQDALEMLEQDKIRNAAEKAWGATKRASDALILERTGEEPEKSPITSRELRRLGGQDPRIESLVARYYTRMGALHGECFYLGLCDPIDTTEQLIRETLDYIRDAENLAASP